jgi:pantoate kinase
VDGGRRSRDERRGWAWAPAHLTGLFRPEVETEDPRGRGSVGAGLVLELGARAEARWRPGRTRRVVLRWETNARLPISEEVATRLADAGPTPGRLEVRLRHELPIGQGFGMSAAGALATALAVATALGLEGAKAIQVAHLADLFGRGGLGGVAAIAGGGGLEIREKAGIPPWGLVTHRPFRRAIVLAVIGPPRPSPRVLADRRFLRRVRAAADRQLPGLLRRPSESRFLRASETFGDEVRLAPPRVRRAIEVLRGEGAWSSQAMFGNALWAVAKSGPGRARVLRRLERLGLPAVELRASGTGPLAGPVRSGK